MNKFATDAKGLKSGTAKTETIRVAEKIIADISTGIYRTPAAALKELVTNAYDAEATKVRITTDAPRFETLVIHDNGNGMDIERFLEVFKHIGGSWKRIENPKGITPTLQRPVIGRIGIGLLAVAQLGQRFYVSSTRRGSPSRFLAEIDLRAFHKDDAALQTMGSPDNKIDIGMIKYVDGLPEPKDTHFTIITVLGPKQGLVSELHGQLRKAVGAEAEFTVDDPAPTYQRLIDAVLDGKRADTVLDSYHYLLWELGLLAPVPYYRDKIFETSKRRVEGAEQIGVPTIPDFKVTVDKYEICRPIRFPNPCAVNYGGPTPIVYALEHDRHVAGRRLHFTGYVYSQQPRIDPAELQGLQIRIRHVGIGPFDKTWMGYPFDEGMKFGQVSGEIYVHEGLESALNIDRASFRETDPHYLALRAWVWNHLQKKVFPDFKKRQDQFRADKKEAERDALEKKLSEALAKAPEIVGVRPRTTPKKKPTPALREPTAPPKTSPQRSTKHQSIVLVEDGEAVIDQDAFARFSRAFGGAQKDRLLRVCAVLAAYGVWSRLSPEEAEELLGALAVAVEQ